MICIATNKKKNYGALFVPDVPKNPSVKSSQTASQRSGGVFAELERLKDELAKRNRDQDDILNNLSLSNFTPDVRNRLEKVLLGSNNNQNNDTESNGGTE